jgi:hypothetical protein
MGVFTLGFPKYPQDHESTSHYRGKALRAEAAEALSQSGTTGPAQDMGRARCSVLVLTPGRASPGPTRSGLCGS